MDAIFIKNIEFEMRAVHDNRPEWIMTRIPGPEMYRIQKEGEPSYMMQNIKEEIRFQRMTIKYVDEHKVTQEKNYFVKVDDKGLFNDLMRVSDGFIQEKIDEACQRIIRDYENRYIPEEIKRTKEITNKKKIEQIKSLPWWKRLFKQF